MAYPNTNPKQGDSDNELLKKIAQSLGVVTTERDTKNNLLFKICQKLAGTTGV